MTLTKYSKFQLENHPVVKAFISQQMEDETFTPRVRVTCISELTISMLLGNNPDLLSDINLVTPEMCQAIRPKLHESMSIMETGIARIYGHRSIDLVVEDLQTP